MKAWLRALVAAVAVLSLMGGVTRHPYSSLYPPVRFVPEGGIPLGLPGVEFYVGKLVNEAPFPVRLAKAEVSGGYLLVRGIPNGTPIARIPGDSFVLGAGDGDPSTTPEGPEGDVVYLYAVPDGPGKVEFTLHFEPLEA